MIPNTSASSQDIWHTKRYQQITLPDGRVMLGNDRSYLKDIVFGGDVSGQTMLDIGSSQGSFCIEGLRRGMSMATGLEVYPDDIRIAGELAKQFGVEPTYIQGDFETWETDETYDRVLCLNVLHHMYDPVHAIRRMMRMARRKIVLEVAVPRLGDVKPAWLSPLFLFLAKRIPLIHCGCRGSIAHAASRTFLFTPQVLQMIFNYHSQMYEPIRTYKSPMKKRLVVEARKRIIRHLTVICGPTCSGKTTLMRRLESDAELRRTLDLPEKVSAAVGRINAELPLGPQEHVMFHYDMLRPFGRSIRSHERDPACDLIRLADKVTFLTILTPAPRLRQQIFEHEVGKRVGFWKRIRKVSEGRQTARHRKLLKYYGNGDFLYQRYKEWFDFCAKFKEKTVDHVIVENEGEYRFHPGDKWEELCRDALYR